jgi:2-polyprenyl-6-methoxyphenol hydroxylase-like FAD-dependent oxidoreductase
MQNCAVLISGAGIAGPALAHWLRRYGSTPTVEERAPALRSDGYMVDLRGIAVTVAERTGILDEVRRHASDMLGASVVDGSGRRLADFDADFVSAERATT